MSNVTRIGGVFFRSPDPIATAKWYGEHLGLPIEEAGNTACSVLGASGHDATWATFPDDTDYFGPTDQQFMVNLVTPDLEATLTRLRAAGIKTIDKAHDSDFGKFGWAVDCDGRRFELWQPPPTKAG